MRITNTMMNHSTMRNVGKSKNNLADIESQVSSEKKIIRPSDNPLIAIRALSLRTSVNEIDMYLKKNVPAAQAWLDISTTALDNMDTIFTDIKGYCNQGSSDEFSIKDRSAIIDVLKQYKDAIYSEANASNAGRYCFSGYKTDTAFTFLTDEDANAKYEITQTFSGKDVDKSQVIVRSVDETTITNIPAANTPVGNDYYRLRLAYSDCLETGNSNTVTVDGSAYNVTRINQDDLATLSANGTLKNSGRVYYLYDTGELVIPDNLANTFQNADVINFTYQKDGFTKGEPRPEMYFDCKNITDPANPVDFTFDPNGQEITFTVNFSQTIKVNTLGCETLSYNIGRDIDDMCNALSNVEAIEKKIAKLQSQKDAASTSSTDKDRLDTMITAAKKEWDYAIDHMKKLFSNGISKTDAYQEQVDLQIADLGARSKRLELTKSRLTEQLATFKDLKSQNEDVDLEETIVEYSSAKTLYQAALTAASNVVKQSLLDYI